MSSDDLIITSIFNTMIILICAYYAILLEDPTIQVKHVVIVD